MPWKLFGGYGCLVYLVGVAALSIVALAANYGRANMNPKGIKRHGWRRPKDGYVKLNIDAAFSLDLGTGATEAVIHDEFGVFLAASNNPMLHVESAAMAEARALGDGLILAGQLGCSKLIVNSDCMEVVESMHDGGNSLGPAVAIYEDCNFLAHGFDHVIV